VTPSSARASNRSVYVAAITRVSGVKTWGYEHVTAEGNCCVIGHHLARFGVLHASFAEIRETPVIGKYEKGTRN
jgi:hypothetical protein